MRKLIFSFFSPFLFCLVAFSQQKIISVDNQQITQATTNENQKMNIQEITLENGLTVFLNEDHTRPEVFGLLLTKAGAKNDPAEATGLAHYMEHMLFKGTRELGTTSWESEEPYIKRIYELYDQLGKTKDEKQRADIQQQINEQSLKANEFAIPNEFSNVTKSFGGTHLNANTSSDRTVFFNSFPPNQIERWLELNSNRFLHPVFRSFQSELEVVYEEKNMYSDMFQFSLIEEFQKKFFKNHPYGQQPMIGTIEHLKNPSLTKMSEFYKTYYVANNMALILSGDFKTDEILPLIREKFGKLPSGTLPDKKIYKEEPFIGRELVNVKLTPIKLALLGFRTATAESDDFLPLQVCNQILSNPNQTGLLDKLALDNKLLAAMMITLPYYDEGISILFIVPKLLGQKLSSAESLVMSELEKLRKGEFDGSMLEAIKLQMYRDYLLSLESNEKRAIAIAENFAQNQPLEELTVYPERIKQITREDVIRVANQYYNTNYLAFFSTTGFPKKEKIEKPGFKPVISNTKEKSKLAKQLEQMKEIKPEFSFIDFNKDVKNIEINKLTKLYVTQNPYNDIFSLKIKFGIGTHFEPRMKYAAELLNYSGTATKDVSQLKLEFGKIGCTYMVKADESCVSIELEGVESNLPKALELLNELITNPKADSTKIQILIESEKSTRKIERSEADQVADALFDFVRFGDKSQYINRLTMRQIKKLTTVQLLADFQKAMSYETTIHYVGNQSLITSENLTKLIQKTFTVVPTIASEIPVVIPQITYNEPLVYFIQKKKASQCKIYFFANGENFKPEIEPLINSFNLYFGGDFSGLVLQEIREYRSLAYTAGARYSIPKRLMTKSDFVGYIGTQADKTNEAIQVFNDLLKNMPEKSDRINMIRSYLIESLLTSKPSFREMSESIADWKSMGNTCDPAIGKLKVYENLQYADIEKFYKGFVQNHATVIAIVGNKKNFNLKELSKYGKIQIIKEKKVFNE